MSSLSYLSMYHKKSVEVNIYFSLTKLLAISYTCLMNKMTREARLAYLVSIFWSRKTVTVNNLGRYNRLIKALQRERSFDTVDGMLIGKRFVRRVK